jgi:hypothetical protein
MYKHIWCHGLLMLYFHGLNVMMWLTALKSGFNRLAAFSAELTTNTSEAQINAKMFYGHMYTHLCGEVT